MLEFVIVYLAILFSIYHYGGIEGFMFGMCFGIGYLSAFHMFYFIDDYFVRKKKMEVMYRDLDSIISPEFLTNISSSSSYDTPDTKFTTNNDDEKERDNICEQLPTD